MVDNTLVAPYKFRVDSQRVGCLFRKRHSNCHSANFGFLFEARDKRVARGIYHRKKGWTYDDDHASPTPAHDE